jgi:uncharacterized membrane protein YphA (DoxX/SURF4 family)
MNRTYTNAGRLPRRNLLFRVISFSWLKKSALIEIISHLFIILFLYTGIAKLMEFDVFQEQLAESPIMAPVAGIVSIGLPVTEFIVCLLLFFPRFRLKGLYAAFVLMVLFTAYVAILMATSKELPCSCGGIMEELSWEGHLVFNGIMILLSLYALIMQIKLTRVKSEIEEERLLTSHV